MPALGRVSIDRELGKPIVLLAYAPETTGAEKACHDPSGDTTTIRWRDYDSNVQRARRGFNNDELLRSAHAGAHYRCITFEPVAPHLVGYGAIAKTKWWAAWRREDLLGTNCETDLDDQARLVADCLDPILLRGAESRQSKVLFTTCH